MKNSKSTAKNSVGESVSREKAQGTMGAADVSERYPITSVDNRHDSIRFINPEIGLVREFSSANDGDSFYDLADQFYFERKGAHLNFPDHQVASSRMVAEKQVDDSEELESAQENVDSETKKTVSEEDPDLAKEDEVRAKAAAHTADVKAKEAAKASKEAGK